MNASTADLIEQALLDPHSVSDFSPGDWDVLVRQGKRANLLARLASILSEQDLLESVPAAPRQHLHSALLMARWQQQSVRGEVDRIARELADMGTPIVLLKGAAYVVANNPVSKGRLFSDIDILVPKASIGLVEAELMRHGWQSTHHSEYDQRYYRQWMHELPPMRHVKRGTTIDVHHGILPDTARLRVNSAALLDGIVGLPGRTNLFVLSPVDMFLHSATHLFHEGDFEKGLRDLFDLDILLRHFGPTAGFWDALVPRATALGLVRPLYYALRFTTLKLRTPVPRDVLAKAEIGKPHAILLRLMDACYLRVLRPAHASADSFGSGAARLALYVRSHWIRMPAHLLLRHLARKAIMSLQSEPKRTAQQALDADANTP